MIQHFKVERGFGGESWDVTRINRSGQGWQVHTYKKFETATLVAYFLNTVEHSNEETE
ncbi:hypothetical protein ACN20G_23565 [Streptomyces sp. BI20]|uniref:hypothetical protein n=1 Tax=Streptomyces sp. BI20 TaxID=3403460 RepID=UPI003C73AD25